MGIWGTLPMAASEWYDFARKKEKYLKLSRQTLVKIKPEILIRNWITVSEIQMFLILIYG